MGTSTCFALINALSIDVPLQSLLLGALLATVAAFSELRPISGAIDVAGAHYVNALYTLSVAFVEILALSGPMHGILVRL